MNIQMGLVQDTSEVFKELISKSHNGNPQAQDAKGMYYAAGWEVNTHKSIIEHAGGNPNFATKVAMFPKEQMAICFLSNGASTNINLVESIKGILDGDLTQSYKMSSIQLWDIFLSSATMIVSLLAIMLFLLGSRRKKVNKRQASSKKRIYRRALWLIITASMGIICWTLPIFIGYDWPTLLVWQPYSLVTGLISLVILTASITYYMEGK